MRGRRGRGEGGVYQRSDGKWVGAISLGYDGNGRRRRRTVYGDTKKAVQQKLRRLQTSADVGALSHSGRLTVGEHVAHWLEHVAGPRVHTTTYERYEQIARLHVIDQLGGVQLSNLRAAHVEQFYAHLAKKGASGRSRQACGQLLTAALKHAVKTKLIPFSPAAEVPKPRPDHKEMQFLTPSQVNQFLAAAKGYRLYALFAIAVATGLRQGELLGLRWADIDLDAGSLAVNRSLAQIKGEFLLKEPKSASSRRVVALPRFAIDALRDHRAAMLAEGNITAPIFCTRTGQFIGKSNLTRQVFQPILKKAGLPMIRFHDLRHTHATSLLSAGYSVKAVSQRLGHANAKLTLTVYAHVLPTDDQALADGLNRMIGG